MNNSESTNFNSVQPLFTMNNITPSHSQATSENRKDEEEVYHSLKVSIQSEHSANMSNNDNDQSENLNYTHNIIINNKILLNNNIYDNNYNNNNNLEFNELMNKEPHIQIGSFQRNTDERPNTLDFNKSDNRFLSSENLNKLQSFNHNIVDTEYVTHKSLTNISIENTEVKSQITDQFGKK